MEKKKSKPAGFTTSAKKKPKDRAENPDQKDKGIQAGDIDDDDAEEVGLPRPMRIKRRYTLSAAALEQRRAASKQPKDMAGLRNNYKTGQYAKTFLTRIKPCLSTCKKYPCDLVEDGATAPGGDCLDVAELLHIIRSVHRAIMDPEKGMDQFKEISAASIGNSIKILEMLQEDILRDGTVIRTTHVDGKGNTIQEVKPHPSLFSLPKMIAELNLTPDKYLLTPQAKAKVHTEEEAVKSISDLMAAAGAQLRAAKEKKGKKTTP